MNGQFSFVFDEEGVVPLDKAGETVCQHNLRPLII